MKLKKLSKLGACVVISSIALSAVGSAQSAKAISCFSWLSRGWTSFKNKVGGLELSLPKFGSSSPSKIKVSDSSNTGNSGKFTQFKNRVKALVKGSGSSGGGSNEQKRPKLTVQDIEVQLPHYKRNNNDGNDGNNSNPSTSNGISLNSRNNSNNGNGGPGDYNPNDYLETSDFPSFMATSSWV